MPIRTPAELAGRYRVIERLGTGGMATVYLAEDERLGRKVAIKQLHSDSPDDAARRFEREAKVGASLSHPNLVTVFDTVPDDDGVLIVMEYVTGENLAQLMARERLSPERALAILTAVAGALDHAHAAGVIHRDVKPANMLVTPSGQVKLVDLGIATAAERTQITSAGTVLGTPSYMAPEQLEGKPLTKAVDVYALGAVAFELLSGQRARRGRTPFEIAHQIATEPAPDLRQAWPDAPRAAADVLARAMSSDPAKRQASAGELARQLERALAPRGDDRTATTRPIAAAAAPGAPLKRLPRRTPERVAYRRALPSWLVPTALALVALVVLGAVIALSNGSSPTAPVVPPTTKHAAGAKHRPAHAQQPAQPATPATGGASQGVALHLQAHNLINQGQYEQAIPLERKAVELLAPSGRIEYWYALYDLGHALRLAGHPDQAIPILEKRLQNPNQRDVVQAELAQAKKDLESAKKHKKH
jgi:eukaryotic-like serine/threonine-protein kinase